MVVYSNRISLCAEWVVCTLCFTSLSNFLQLFHASPQFQSLYKFVFIVSKLWWCLFSSLNDNFPSVRLLVPCVLPNSCLQKLLFTKSNQCLKMSAVGCHWQLTAFCGEATCVMTLRLLLYLIHLYIFNCCVLYTIPGFFSKGVSKQISFRLQSERAYQNLGAITLPAHSKFYSFYCPSGPITLCWQSRKRQADPRSWKSSLSQQGTVLVKLFVPWQ